MKERERGKKWENTWNLNFFQSFGIQDSFFFWGGGVNSAVKVNATVFAQ